MSTIRGQDTDQMGTLVTKPSNQAINHVALSCTDLVAVVEWYTTHLGFELIGKVRHFNRRHQPEPFETIFVSYPDTLMELKFAILTSANGVGLELFQFIDPPVQPTEEAFQFTRPGFFHICITDTNPEFLLERIKQAGGSQIGQWMDYSRYGLYGHMGVYTRDPWGNIIEIMSLSMERVCSAGAGVAWKTEQIRKEQQQEIQGSAGANL